MLAPSDAVTQYHGADTQYNDVCEATRIDPDVCVCTLLVNYRKRMRRVRGAAGPKSAR